jgi:2-iminoacetate synthase
VTSTVPVILENRPDAVPEGSAAAAVLAFMENDLAGLREVVASAGAADVDRALRSTRLTPADFAALLSPAAQPRLEDLAVAAHATTVQRFGRVVRMFAPLYLSNECVSTCTYCGFSAGNAVVRRTLSPDEALAEARALRARGFRNILLVAGEHARIVSRDYLVDCVRALAPEVPSLSVEVQVWDGPTYGRLAAAGCEGVVAYQETYDPATYEAVHLKGKKRNYAWRLAAPDRAAEAGMRRLGIGVLLGLHADWRADALVLAAHARALVRRWWRCDLTVAMPRLRDAAGRRVHPAPLCAAPVPARRRHLALDAGASRPARRPAAPGRHPAVGGVAHRARRLRLAERRRAPVQRGRRTLTRRGRPRPARRRLRPGVDGHDRRPTGREPRAGLTSGAEWPAEPARQ